MCLSGHFFVKIYRDINFFLYNAAPPCYTTSFQKQVINYVTEGSCVARGEGTASYKKKLKSLYILTKKCPDRHKISIIDILIFVIQIYSRYPKLWCFLYFMNEKLNKNANVEQLTKMPRRSVRLIVILPLRQNRRNLLD